MRQSIASLSVLATAAFAQSTTVEFFFPGGSYEGPDPAASIVEANPSTTIMNLACPTSDPECGFEPSYQYSIISSTVYQYSASMTADKIFFAYNCDHNTKAAEMTCSVSIGGEGFGDSEETTTVLSGTEIGFISATVTAGASLLGAAATGAAVTSDATARIRSSVPIPTSSPTQAASTGLQTSVSSTTTTTTTPTSLASGVADAADTATTTGAAFRYGVDGSVLLALAGAAAVHMW